MFCTCIPKRLKLFCVFFFKLKYYREAAYVMNGYVYILNNPVCKVGYQETEDAIGAMRRAENYIGHLLCVF